MISISSVISQVVAGYLFENFGHMSLIYVAVASSLLNALIFIALTGISKRSSVA